MPYKHNANRRHKIKKAKYKVTNWHDYNKSLRKRGDFTVWFTEEAIADWHPAKCGARGRPREYSDVAIETSLLIRQVFHLPLLSINTENFPPINTQKFPVGLKRLGFLDSLFPLF